MLIKFDYLLCKNGWVSKMSCLSARGHHDLVGELIRPALQECKHINFNSL